MIHSSRLDQPITNTHVAESRMTTIMMRRIPSLQLICLLSAGCLLVTALLANVRTTSAQATTDYPLYLPIITANGDSLQPAPTPSQPGNYLSPAERSVIIQQVETRVNALLPPINTPLDTRDFQQELVELSTELLKIPGVFATLISTPTLTVQVVMEDGLSIAIVNNRPIEPPPVPQAAQAAALHRTQLERAIADAPSSNKAVVTNFDGGDAVAAEVRTLVSKAGYAMQGRGASLNDMMNYKDLGFLYLDTHGVQYQHFSFLIGTDGVKTLSPGPMVYGLQTSTQADLSSITTYQNELNNGEIILSLGEEKSGRTVKYAITDKFIQKYWSFKDAVVIIHSCYGGAQPFKPGVTCQGGGCFSGTESGVLNPAALRSAMISKGASAVVSFDNLTNADYARPSLLFLLDRLLGSNQIQAESNPPLRPFGLEQVRAEMGQRNLLSFYRPNKVIFGIEYGGGNTVSLTFDTADAQALLAPSIERIEVKDDPDKSRGELEILGSFGKTEGKVTLDNMPATITSWSPNKIVVTTPHVGSGSAGDLLVISPDGVKSNPVPITHWRGTITIKQQMMGSLQAQAQFDLYFRGDIHPSRASLTAAPSTQTQILYLHSGAQSKITASGQYVSDAGDTLTWHGNYPVTAYGKDVVDLFAQQPLSNASQADETENRVGGIITINPKSNEADICLFYSASYDTTIHAEGSTFDAKMMFIDPFLLEADYRKGALGCHKAALLGDKSIKGGDKQMSWEEFNLSMEWSSFTPVALPDPQTPG